MRVDIDKLKQKIKDSGKTETVLATELGVDYSTFFRKMKGDGIAFTVGQMHKIADILHLSTGEASEIFLSENLQ